jgi:predicted MPP superfamily phosphohydrolase
MEDTLTWLHLSDLHCCPGRTDWDADRVLRTLRIDLEDLAARQRLRPNLIFFTGDAAFGELPDSPIADQLAAAGRFFEKVRKLCDVERESVFLVPGNHDVHRGEVSSPMTEWLDARAARNALDEVVELVRSGGRDWQSVAARLAAYRKFLEDFGYHHLLDDDERLLYGARRRIRGHEMAVAGLDSAWSCGREGEKGRLWMAGKW